MIESGATEEQILRMPSTLRKMVVLTSLMKGKLTDTIYFQYSNPKDMEE